jgi:aerobic-type carbon monoxide dehydrogenase small subunit (CoxS/CutS family)
MDVAGHTVETVEAIGGKELSSLQNAFIQQDAMQCGYCIPGFVVSAEALIRRKPDATRKDIESALSSNLCRCGSQPHIVEAILGVLGESKNP